MYSYRFSVAHRCARNNCHVQFWLCLETTRWYKPIETNLRQTSFSSTNTLHYPGTYTFNVRFICESKTRKCPICPRRILPRKMFFFYTDRIYVPKRNPLVVKCTRNARFLLTLMVHLGSSMPPLQCSVILLP